MRPWGAWAALVLLGACGSPAPSDDVDSSVGCTQSSDCPAGQVCYADGCGEAMDFAVRVTPHTGDFVAQDFNPVSVAMSRMDLSLQDPGILEGTLTTRSRDHVAAFQQKFEIERSWRSVAIPGLGAGPPIVTTFTNGDRTGHYTLAVSPGIWRIRATPAAPDRLLDGETSAAPVLPPVLSERAVSSGGVVDPQLVLPGEPLNEIQGLPTLSAGAPWPARSKALLRYQAFDPTSGIPVSQPALFLATSVFHVFTAKTPGLLLRAGADLTSSAGAAALRKEWRADDQGAFPPFELGDWSSFVTVSGTVQAIDGVAVAGADVRAEGRVRGGGICTATAKTDLNGHFVLSVLPSDPGDGARPPATYAVVVRPPSRSASATARVSVAIGSQATTLPAIACPPKVALSGRLLGPGPSGKAVPLADVRMVIEPLPSAGKETPNAGDVTTKLDGFWSVSVEPGSYRVTAMPSPGRLLPWGITDVTITESTALPDMSLPEAREIAGSVAYRNRDGTATPVVTATVTIYRASSAAQPAPVKLAEVLTNSRGYFKVVLPKTP